MEIFIQKIDGDKVVYTAYLDDDTQVEGVVQEGRFIYQDGLPET